MLSCLAASEGQLLRKGRVRRSFLYLHWQLSIFCHAISMVSKMVPYADKLYISEGLDCSRLAEEDNLHTVLLNWEGRKKHGQVAKTSELLFLIWQG